MVPAREDGEYTRPHTVLICLVRLTLYHRGIEGEEVQDAGFTMNNARRRSNSSSYTAGLKDFKTKFEHVEHDPVFEEDLHGANDDDDEMPETRRVNTDSSEGSFDDDDKVKAV